MRRTFKTREAPILTLPDVSGRPRRVIGQGPGKEGGPISHASEGTRVTRAAVGVAAAILAGLALLSGPGSGAGQEPASEPDSAAAANVVHAIIAADNAADLAAVMALYTARAELWPPGEPPVRGATAIEARYRRIFATGHPDLRTTVHAVRAASEWALVEGEVRGTVVPAAGGDPTGVDDKFLMVLERTAGGGWKIARLMWSSNGAPP